MAVPNHDEDTAEYVTSDPFSERFFDSSKHGLQLEFGAATHRGHVRTNNEDHYAILRRRRTSELILTNLAPDDVVLTDDSVYALVVADGMGGARFGEFASRLALQRMFELAQQATSWVMKLKDVDAQQIRQRVDAYVLKIQDTMRQFTATEPALAGMGTTWTSAHLLLPHALVVHIGDSRAYLLHEGQLSQITRDETVAQALIDAGSPPDTVTRFRHMLLNSFGGDGDKVTAQIHQVQLDAQDQLLLCTDGLTDMVSNQEITAILQKSSSAQSACDTLVKAALDNGGHDNVTVTLATVS